MIRPVNDFRIGNLVLDEDGELCKIEQLSSEKMECFQQVSNIENKSCISTKYPSNIYAIELTEEWLLKLGFEKTDRYWSFTNDLKFLIELDIEGNYCLRVKLSKYLSAFVCQVNFVHLLQNAMFILRGEELFSSTEP